LNISLQITSKSLTVNETSGNTFKVVM